MKILQDTKESCAEVFWVGTQKSHGVWCAASLMLEIIKTKARPLHIEKVALVIDGN